MRLKLRDATAPSMSAHARAWLSAALLGQALSPSQARAQATAAAQYLPVCTIANCLNPRVVSKSGIGSANATAEAKVVREDAVA